MYLGVQRSTSVVALQPALQRQFSHQLALCSSRQKEGQNKSFSATRLNKSLPERQAKPSVFSHSLQKKASVFLTNQGSSFEATSSTL